MAAAAVRGASGPKVLLTRPPPPSRSTCRFRPVTYKGTKSWIRLGTTGPSCGRPPQNARSQPRRAPDRERGPLVTVPVAGGQRADRARAVIEDGLVLHVVEDHDVVGTA